MSARPVSSIGCHSEEGYEVSFTHSLDGEGGVGTLALSRVFRLEQMLPPGQRMVAASDDGPGSDGEIHALERLDWEDGRVTAWFGGARYELDVAGADPEEQAEARRILAEMNPDGIFDLRLKNNRADA